MNTTRNTVAQPKAFMENDLRLAIEEEPSFEDLEAFKSILRSLNRLKTGEPGYRKVFIAARDSNDKIVGALNGEMYLGWLFIEDLAIDDKVSNKGLGAQLLQAAEDEARKRRCYSIYLETRSFQGLPFYQKHGFKIFGELKDCPIGHSRLFLYKRLPKD